MEREWLGSNGWNSRRTDPGVETPGFMPMPLRGAVRKDVRSRLPHLARPDLLPFAFDVLDGCLNQLRGSFAASEGFLKEDH
jgi:hypothetical protein